MSERLKREYCVGILVGEICQVMAGELRDERQPVPPIAEGFRRLDRPAVLRILVRTKASCRPDMAGFVIHQRPDLSDYVAKCLAYLRGERADG